MRGGPGLAAALHRCDGASCNGAPPAIGAQQAVPDAQAVEGAPHWWGAEPLFRYARYIQYRVMMSIMLACLAQMIEAVLAQLLAGNFYRCAPRPRGAGPKHCAGGRAAQHCAAMACVNSLPPSPAGPLTPARCPACWSRSSTCARCCAGGSKAAPPRRIPAGRREPQTLGRPRAAGWSSGSEGAGGPLLLPRLKRPPPPWSGEVQGFASPSGTV